MQLAVTISDEVVLLAEAHSMPVVDFVKMLIDEGLAQIGKRDTVSNAIERIRALRAVPPPFRGHRVGHRD